MHPEIQFFIKRRQTLRDNSPILAHFENKIFIGVGLPHFREGQMENGAKTGKCSIFQGFDGKFFQFVLEW